MYEEQIKKGLDQAEAMADALFETHEKFMELKRKGKSANIDLDEIMAQCKLSSEHGSKVMGFFHAEGVAKRQQELAKKMIEVKKSVN